MISFRERSPVVIGLASLVGITIGLGFAFYLNRIPFIARDYDVKAEFADAAGLTIENEVRVAGIKVGKVTAVELLRDRVLVSMEIDDGIDIPKKATAKISLKTILGTKLVAIDAAGRAPFLEEGDTIPLAQTSIPFEIFQASNSGVELLSEIDADRLNEGFQALADISDDPNRNLARALEGGAEVTGALASQSDALQSLLVRGDELLETLDESSPEIQQLLADGDRVLQLLSARRDTVQSLLRNTERLLGSFGGLLRDNRPQIDSILRDLHTTLLVVDANLAELEQAVRLLGPTSESFARITWRGRWAGICIFALEAAPPTASNPVDCGP
ncbi:MAG: MCE family protein [Actinomycetota bacterium]